MKSKKFLFTAIMCLATSINAHASREHDFFKQRKYYGISYNYNLMANKLSDNSSSGYNNSAKAKQKFGGSLFYGLHINPNFDGQVTFEFGKMSRTKFYNSSFLFETGNPGSVEKVLVDAKDTLAFNFYKFTADFYYNLIQNKRITPYIGGGVGISLNKTSENILGAVNYNERKFFGSKTSINPALSLEAGTKIKLRKKHDLKIFYKFQDLGKVKNKNFYLESNDILYGEIYHKLSTKLRIHTFGVAYIVTL